MIEYHEVWKSFGKKPVLRGVTLEIKDGETFFVLGKTGAGKTVMIRLLVGLLRPDQGGIRVDGEEIAGLSELEFQKIRLKCGMVFQLPTLFDSLSVFENVAFGLRRLGGRSESELEDEVQRALTEVELSPDLMDRSVHELSFGEQKRVGLARTLILSPAHLLYDEPTTGLDPFTAGKINSLIRRVNQTRKATAVVVSHDLDSMARIADRVGLLWEGQFRFVGAVEEFERSDDPAVVEFRRGWERGES
jgi:phospholipid/cholesterol/gamma-HCH transport system ATP-binding protein